MGYGAQGEIIEKIRETIVSAFVDKIPDRFTNRGVICRDAPTDSRFIRGPNRNYLFTGKQFFETIFRTPLEALRGNASVWIECLDLYWCVTREKSRERLKRTESKKKHEGKKDSKDKVPRYASDIVICEHGIRNKDGTVSMFDIRGIASNAQLSHELWNFVMEMLMTAPIPPGTCFILHHLHTGPKQFINNPGSQFNIMLEMKQYAHVFGECDHQMAFWARVFSATQEDVPQTLPPAPWFEVRSNDSDVLLILCDMVSETYSNITDEKAAKSQTQIYWNRGKIKGGPRKKKTQPKQIKDADGDTEMEGGDDDEEEELHDKAKFHPLICVNTVVSAFKLMKFPIRKLILIAHMFGSDYVLKSDLTEGIGFRVSWPTIKENLAMLDPAMKVCWGDFVIKNRGCVWMQLLGAGDTHEEFKRRAPCFNTDIAKAYIPEVQSNDKAYERAVAAILNFAWKLPKRKIKDGDERRGAEDALWALQYHTFPMGCIELVRPSNFIEKQDMEVNKVVSSS